MAFSKVASDISTSQLQVYAGGETAGIPFAALMADRANRPMAYIRKQPKGFGRCSQIEGLTEKQLSEGKKFLLVEDLCSDGGSKMNFIQAIRRSGNLINHALVVYSYGCFGATEALRNENVELHSLTNGETLVNVAEDLGVYSADVISQVRDFLANPEGYAARYAEAPTPGTPEEIPDVGSTPSP
jgi:orotate phosphoribosyltransferase